jgi:hypothetical protein
MKTMMGGGELPHMLKNTLARAVIIAGALYGFFLATFAQASVIAPGGGDSGPTYIPLNSWSFNDTNFWTSDNGCAPLSFTNLVANYMGDGTDLVINNPGNPAWLQFAVTNASGASNLTVDVGSVTFWYAPDWSSTNMGGSGPGEYARLLEIGGYTPDSSFGWWSLYVDDVGANLYFSAQTNDFSSNVCTYVSAPITWTTNYWHFIAFTYSTTNTALYLDGALAASGPAITNYPGANTLATGFFIGSDRNGVLQAEGMIDDLYTYNVPLDADTVATSYEMVSIEYILNPFNRPEITSADYNPSTNSVTPDAITGSGDLQWIGTAACDYGANAYQVWLTNVTATAAGNGTMNVTFTILGSQEGSGDVFDVFANSALVFGPNSNPWAWMGQGAPCNTYALTGLPDTACFLVLGTPEDSDGADLTDAYQALVSHTVGNTNSVDGVLTGWEALLGLNPNNGNLTDPTKRANYGYTPADWLNGVTGVKAGAINSDNEGNVTSVSQ